MSILGLKGWTLPVAHLHHITSLSAQSTTFKEAHKDFHLSIHNMKFLSLNGLVISFLYNLELPAKYATQSGIQIFLTTKTIALQNCYCTLCILKVVIVSLLADLLNSNRTERVSSLIITITNLSNLIGYQLPWFQP